jgi:hypothetical protein
MQRSTNLFLMTNPTYGDCPAESKTAAYGGIENLTGNSALVEQ